MDQKLGNGGKIKKFNYRWNLKNRADVSEQCGIEANFFFLIWKNIYINGNDPVKRGTLMILEGRSSQGSRFFKKIKD